MCHRSASDSWPQCVKKMVIESVTSRLSACTDGCKELVNKSKDKFCKVPDDSEASSSSDDGSGGGAGCFPQIKEACAEAKDKIIKCKTKYDAHVEKKPEHRKWILGILGAVCCVVVLLLVWIAQFFSSPPPPPSHPTTRYQSPAAHHDERGGSWWPWSKESAPPSFVPGVDYVCPFGTERCGFGCLKEVAGDVRARR